MVGAWVDAAGRLGGEYARFVGAGGKEGRTELMDDDEEELEF